jgi:hypothetical protein
LQRRLKRIETAEKPKPSPIAVWYGSFDKFVDTTYPEIIEGKLCDEFYDIIDPLRGWEELYTR